MNNVDELAVQASKNDDFLADFVRKYEHFIAKCAFQSTKRYISKSDDEWSIALIAFSDAVKTYSQDRGSFLHYAETIIKNRLIDYFRTEQTHKLEYSVSPSVFDTEPEEDDGEMAIKISVAEKLVSNEDHSIKYEIEAITKVFQTYGFSFYDLAECSPKSLKTKAACRQAVLYILDHKILMDELKQTKQLPIKILQNYTGLPRKLLEHHRKYIIAAMEILSGEYPHLAEYVSFIRKGGRAYESSCN